jgi:hypothetical protein
LNDSIAEDGSPDRRAAYAAASAAARLRRRGCRNQYAIIPSTGIRAGAWICDGVATRDGVEIGNLFGELGVAGDSIWQLDGGTLYRWIDAGAGPLVAEPPAGAVDLPAEIVALLAGEDEAILVGAEESRAYAPGAVAVEEWARTGYLYDFRARAAHRDGTTIWIASEVPFESATVCPMAVGTRALAFPMNLPCEFLDDSRVIGADAFGLYLGSWSSVAWVRAVGRANGAIMLPDGYELRQTGGIWALGGSTGRLIVTGVGGVFALEQWGGGEILSMGDRWFMAAGPTEAQVFER